MMFLLIDNKQERTVPCISRSRLGYVASLNLGNTFARLHYAEVCS